MTDQTKSDRAPYKHERGPEWMSYLYLMWRQLLAWFDLLGPDGRPSSTKLVALIVTMTLQYVAVVRAAKTEGEPWTWPMFWTQLAVFAVLFGRTKFSEYMDVLKSKNNPPGL